MTSILLFPLPQMQGRCPRGSRWSGCSNLISRPVETAGSGPIDAHYHLCPNGNTGRTCILNCKQIASVISVVLLTIWQPIGTSQHCIQRKRYWLPTDTCSPKIGVRPHNAPTHKYCMLPDSIVSYPSRSLASCFSAPLSIWSHSQLGWTFAYNTEVHSSVHIAVHWQRSQLFPRFSHDCRCCIPAELYHLQPANAVYIEPMTAAHNTANNKKNDTVLLWQHFMRVNFNNYVTKKYILRNFAALLVQAACRPCPPSSTYT